MATAQVLPKELRLTAPPTMPQARSYLFKQQSVNSTYEPGATGTIQINLPRLQRSYLTKDSYLKFRLGIAWKNDGADANKPSAPCFDLPGAFGLFDKIEVYDYLGSTLLESTSGHGQLLALLMDTQTSTDELQFHYGANSGTKGGRVAIDQETGLLTNHEVNNLNLIGPGTGFTFQRFNITPATVNQHIVPEGNDTDTGLVTRYYEFSIPLFSFLGLLSQKFAPLHNGYTIQLTLNSAAQVFGFSTKYGTLGGDAPIAPALIPTLNATSAGPSTYQLSNVYLCCQVLELGPVAESMLMASTQGQPFVVPSKAYRQYLGTIPKGSSAYRLDLNLNVASLTNILWIMREQQYQNNLLYKSLSYRIRNYLQSWYFQYGSTMLPQTSGIQCFAPSGVELDQDRGGYNEAYCELMKARHHLNASNFSSTISKRNFWIDNARSGALQEGLPVAITANIGADGYPDAVGIKQDYSAAVMALTADTNYETGKFACGLDLELVSGRSNDLVCGMNTNGMNTSLNLTFDPTRSGSVQLARLDCWCEYDSFINVSPGIATTVSF